MKGKLLEDFDVNSNEFIYKKGDMVDIIEIDGFQKSYGIYYKLEKYNTMDWIPKEIVELINS